MVGRDQDRLGSDGRAIGEVLVKVNDTVFAGEALIRLDDDEVRNRHAKAELQVRRCASARVRRPTGQGPPTGASTRMPSADARDARWSKRAPLSTAPRRRSAPATAPTTTLATARKALAQRAASSCASSGRPSSPSSRPTRRPSLPTELEGQFAMARIDLRGAEAALDNLIVRAPIDGTRCCRSMSAPASSPRRRRRSR